MANDRVKDGHYFIAYIGEDIDVEDLSTALDKKTPTNYTVRETKNYNMYFGKIVYDEYVNYRDPFYDSNNKVLTVSGFNKTEIQNACDKMYNINDSDCFHRIINYLYHDVEIQVFKKLSDYMHFCAIIYDERKKALIAGVTTPNNEYTHLYYGFTDKNKEIIFSNNEDILKEFCSQVYEMEENTYVENNNVYSLECELIGNIIDKSNMTKPFIKNSRENANTLFDGLNALLLQVTEKSVKERIQKNVEDYLLSSDPKKKIEDFIVKELDVETQKNILQMIKKTIDEYDVENNISNKLQQLFDEILNEYTKTIDVPVKHIIKLNDIVLGQTQGGYYHEKFEQILTQVQLDEPIMLIGPAGSGKNVAVQQVADALGKHMYYTNNASNEFKLTGFIDAGGNYRDTEFYKAFKNGGVFFLDEIDNSDPSALIVINSALANGYMAFPHETIDRHPDFRIVAAANTWGKGADLQYVGRNALDGATLDRFDNIFFDYDRNLEGNLYPNEEVLQFMWSFRDAVLKSKIPHIVSTRGIGKVYKKEINHIPVQEILTSNVIKNLGQDDVNSIIGNMNNISSNNKYYSGIKQLRLGR